MTGSKRRSRSSNGKSGRDSSGAAGAGAAARSNAPTAVLLVKGFDGLGLATLIAIQQLFPNEFRNIVFVCVGEVDSSMLKSHEDIEAFEKKIADRRADVLRLRGATRNAS